MGFNSPACRRRRWPAWRSAPRGPGAASPCSACCASAGWRSTSRRCCGSPTARARSAVTCEPPATRGKSRGPLTRPGTGSRGPIAVGAEIGRLGPRAPGSQFTRRSCIARRDATRTGRPAGVRRAGRHPDARLRRDGRSPELYALRCGRPKRRTVALRASVSSDRSVPGVGVPLFLGTEDKESDFHRTSLVVD